VTTWTAEQLDAVLRKGHVRIHSDTSARLVKLMDETQENRITAAQASSEKREATLTCPKPQKRASGQGL
jgi:hypothetical protein